MRLRALLVAALLAVGASAADAHFVLVSPVASLVQNRLGDPQKIAPCGGVSANPGRGTAANPGVPSGAVTPNADGEYSYHHCAVVDITADPAKPMDTRWQQVLR